MSFQFIINWLHMQVLFILKYYNPVYDSLYYKFQETLKYGLIGLGRIEEIVTRYKTPLKKTRWLFTPRNNYMYYGLVAVHT